MITGGKVTPFVGVWIETVVVFVVSNNLMSHPSWVCGLKQKYVDARAKVNNVTPFVGVWIETRNRTKPLLPQTGHTLRGCVD